MKFNNENIYYHGSRKICNFLSRSLQGVRCFVPTVIVTILFCNVNTFLLSHEFPQKIVPYFIEE
jgi:hypothetical protein